MKAVVEGVREFIRQRDLIRPGSRIVAAVSGGSDSMALLHILSELDQAGDLRLAGVAHFNHQLRSAADDDERFVIDVSSALGLICVTGRDDVARRARRDGQSVESAGRTARHEFFERARRQLDADLVAIGHTRDDQAETFLLRLVRGAGPRGLAGMHPRSGTVVRPLLACRRHELRAWLARAHSGPGRGYVEDETNDDVSIPRNRVRAELLPLIEARFNTSIVDALADEAALLQELWAWMKDVSEPFLEVPGVLDVGALRRVPAALQRLVLWRAMTAASGGRQISFEQVAAAARLIEVEDDDPKGLDLPSHRVQRIGGRIVLTAGKGSNPANLFHLPLSIPGEVLIPETGCLVSVEEAGTRGVELNGGFVAMVRRDRVQGSLAVRNRRPGDRFRPVGLNGSKKLQDLFVDRKLPRDERDSVPLVVDRTDRIVWVAGFGIDEAFRVTDASQAVLVLRLTRV